MGLMRKRNNAPTATRASHHGHMGSIARLSPFGLPQPFARIGVPRGRYTDGTTYFQDIHLWKRLGIIEAPIVYCDGDIGSGKTSFAIVSALDAAKLAVEQGRQFRIMYEITRRNVGVAELDTLTKELGAVVIDPQVYGLNLWNQEFGLTPGEQLDVALETFNFIEKRDATTLEVTIIMSALNQFLKKCNSSREYASQAKSVHFEKCLATLTLDQAREAIASTETWALDGSDEQNTSSDTDNGVKSNDEEETKAEGETYLQNEVLATSDIEFNEKEFIRTRNNCLLTFARLRKGEFGRVFNGNHSIAELFAHRALGIDLTSLNETTISFLQTVLWKYKRSAVNSADTDRRRRLIFDWEIHDENREAWLHAPYRREVPRFLKRIRSVNCVMWFNVHRIPGDYATLPKKARLEALNAVREGNIYCHGVHDVDAARKTCKYFTYSSRIFNEMQELNKGDFIIRVRGRGAQRVHITLSQSEIKKTFSEAASVEKTEVSPRLASIAQHG